MGQDNFKPLGLIASGNYAPSSRYESDGADPLDGDNVECSYSAVNYTPTASTLGGHNAGIDTALGLAGGATAIPAPDYVPPDLKYKDADEVTVLAGRYWKGGYRFRGQYQSLTGLATYWDVGSNFDVDIDATYSQGVTSGMIGGAKVNNSWYSIFMTAADELIVLPYVRVDTVDYNVSHAGKTTINSAAHNDGTTAENGFIVANDAWNNYRLVYLERGTNEGTVYTIEDTIDGTPDEIIIDGDQTSVIAATNWLQLIPESATACLYLGTIRIDGSGNLIQFSKSGCETYFGAEISINANASTSAAATDLAAGIPPIASHMICSLRIDGSPTTTTQADLYSDTGGSNRFALVLHYGASGALSFCLPQIFPLWQTSEITNKFIKAGPAAADTAQFRVFGWKE